MVFVQYFLYFLFYSFLGWTMEVLCKLKEFKRFVNRGFLIGPICPIYGCGVLLIVLLIGNPTNDYLGTFLKSILICSVLEYFTSYFMEKIFKARWWDYSKRKFNINGRICLETMLPFGILGTGVVYVVHPAIVKVVNSIPSKLRVIIAIILLIVFLVDNFIAYFVLSKIKKEIKNEAKDNTEIIRDKVLDWLDDNSYLYRRIKKAFPNFVIMFKTVSKYIDKTTKAVIDMVDDAAEAVLDIVDDATDAVGELVDNTTKGIKKNVDLLLNKDEKKTTKKTTKHTETKKTNKK